MSKIIPEFYKKEFWDKIKGDQIDSQEIAGELFDTAVNQGLKKSSIYFQKALNYSNRIGKLFPNIVADGDIGQKTMAAFNKLDHSDGSDDIQFIFNAMNIQQGSYYLEKMDENETKEKYARGWFKRVMIFKQ